MAAATQAAIAAWYIQQMAALRAQVESAQQQAFHGSQDYSDDAADAYVATIVPVMAGAQTAAAQLTAAYLAYMVADMTGQALSSAVLSPLDLAKVTGAALRNGVGPEVVYRRPFQQVWTSIAKTRRDIAEQATERAAEQAAEQARAEVSASHPSEPGRPSQSRQEPDRAPSEPSRPAADARTEPNAEPETDEPSRHADPEPPSDEQIHADAVRDGERRAQTIAATDLQLATTHAAQEVLGANQAVVGYRRVLTGAENCGMCVVASTRLYHKRNLLPIHPACDCVVAPVMAGEDPGRTLNNKFIGSDAVPSAFNKHGVPVFDADQAIDLGDLLQDTHNAIADQFGASYRDAKRIDYRKVITVHQHSETGPTLTVARHKFRKIDLQTGNLRAR